MKESVAVAKEADTMSSATKSGNSIHRVRNEPERQLGSLRSVIDSIRHDGGTPSVDSIATELSGMPTVQRASVLLALQRTHGNRYVQRVVTGIQAKLKVGQPGDVYEREADQVAEQVMRMPEPLVQRQANEEKGKLSIQAKTITPIQALTLQRQDDEVEEELKKKKKEEEEEELIMAKGISSQTLVTSNLEARVNAIRDRGQPLPGSVRDFFEPRFGYDFSQVRVHTDTESDTLNHALNACAFTTGQDIFFRQRAYSPGSSSGRELLAHELTHVVQQGLGSSVTKIQRVVEGDITQMSITADWARNLEDDELEQQIQIVRDQLMTLSSSSPEFEVARSNLQILEQEVDRQNLLVEMPELVITAVACRCDPSTNSSYDNKTYQFLRGIKHYILPISGVPENAVAGAIADEFNTRRGIRTVVDWVQDLIIDALPECFIDVDRFFDIHSKLLNTLENDIGPANIKVRTALELVQREELTVPRSPPSDIQVSEIVNFLLTERGTVEATAAVIRRAQSLFGPYTREHSDALAEAVYVEYFKQGDSYYRRFSDALKTNPNHKVCPGDGGCRYYYNREQINTAIHS